MYVDVHVFKFFPKLTLSKKIVQCTGILKKGEGEKKEELIKISRHPTMFREDNIFPLRAKITCLGGMKIENERSSAVFAAEGRSRDGDGDGSI